MNSMVAEQALSGFRPDPIVHYDPYLPVVQTAGRAASMAIKTRSGQRNRRSRIFATIRRLLTEQGCDNVRVRGVAEESGYAVQTIYNLVGPRNQAISDAISEYSLFVGRTAGPQPADPSALIAIVNRWMEAIKASPEFCRQTNLIFFTESRSIYYQFRDRQLKGMRNLLGRQQGAGIIGPDVDVRSLAEQLVLLMSALCLEWADRPSALETLHRKLRSGCAHLMSDKFTSPYSETALTWIRDVSRPGEPRLR